MSTFRVKLTQGDIRTGQGNLDEQALDNGTSVQRSIYAMGPNKVNRKLNDGDTFTDCNYWKQFAYPQKAYNEAFIEVVSDDGSVYQPGFQSTFVKAYAKTISNGTTHTTENNIIDVLSDTGSYGIWATISSNEDITIRINGNSASDFVVEGDVPFTFNNGDVLFSKITIANASGGNATVSVIFGVNAVCNS